MPILLKSIEASIISIVNDISESNLNPELIYIKSIEGMLGFESYIEFAGFTAITQDFSETLDATNYETPVNIGSISCTSFNILNYDVTE